jgi:adenylate cyclase
MTMITTTEQPPAGIGDTGPIAVIHASMARPDLTSGTDADADGLLLRRTFGFADLSGFTAYTDKAGAAGASAVLREFRDIVREVCSRRGVRVAKWLGDGVMIVGVAPGPVACTVAELVARMIDTELCVRGGVATGRVMLFEGDDYIGPAVNLASRLCDAAGGGTVLSDAASVEVLPVWLDASRSQTLRLKGLGRIEDVRRLLLVDQ